MDRYAHPGAAAFVREAADSAAGDAADAARLRHEVGATPALRRIDTLLGQAGAKGDGAARATLEEAARSLRPLAVALEAGRRALAAFAEGRGLATPEGATPEGAAPAGGEADRLRRRVDELESGRDARIVELEEAAQHYESKLARLDAELATLREENARLAARGPHPADEPDEVAAAPEVEVMAPEPADELLGGLGGPRDAEPRDPEDDGRRQPRRRRGR